MAASCNDVDRVRALVDALCSEKVRTLLVRRLDLKSLLSKSSASLGEDKREKRDLFRRIVSTDQIKQLESLAVDALCSAENVTDEFLSLIGPALGESSLKDFVFWLDRYHADISKALRTACPVTDRSECSVRVSSSASLYSVRSAATPSAIGCAAAAPSTGGGAIDEATMCKRCTAVLAPLLDGSDGDWQKLFDAIARDGNGGKDVCRPAGKAALASCPDQRQTAAILGAWCRLRPRSEATLSQLVRLLHGERCFAAVRALVEQLRIEGESAGVRRMIREAQDAAPGAITPTAVAAAESTSQSGSSFPQQETIGPLAWDSAIVDLPDNLDDPRFLPMLACLAQSAPLLVATPDISVEATGTGVLYRFLCRTAEIEPLAMFERRRGNAKTLLVSWMSKRGESLLLSHVRCVLHECGLDAARDALEVAFGIPTMPASAVPSQSGIVMDEQG